MRDPRSSQLVEANTTEPPNYALTRQQYMYFFFHFLIFTLLNFANFNGKMTV